MTASGADPCLTGASVHVTSGGELSAWWFPEVMKGNVDVKYCYIDVIYKGGYHIYVYIGIHLGPSKAVKFQPQDLSFGG